MSRIANTREDKQHLAPHNRKPGVSARGKERKWRLLRRRWSRIVRAWVEERA